MIRDALGRFSHGPEGWPRLLLMTESGLKKKKKEPTGLHKACLDPDSKPILSSLYTDLTRQQKSQTSHKGRK